jgi:hypothetical protein
MLQITFFYSNEILLSVYYILVAARHLRGLNTQRDKFRKIIGLLLRVQAIAVLLNISVIVVDYVGLLRLKRFVHSFVYYVKLELKFIVLN